MIKMAINYDEAKQTQEKVIAFLEKNGIHDAGVGLAVEEDELIVKVHLSHPLPEDKRINQFDGVKVEYEETGETTSY